jgi:CDP-ribitol ribitolphosphotransferase / teichoic acid ribitol-phosphate polymerase
LTLLISLFNFHLQIIYFFIKKIKTKNRIVFISRQTDKPSLDFNYLISELSKDSNIEIIVLCRRMRNTFKDNVFYYFYMYKQMYYLSTSRVCIIDTFVPTISILKHKKDLKVLQIWHALGAVKKFGYQSVGSNSGRSIKISKLAKMHKNYDAIISTSEKTTKFYSEAFGYDEDKFYNFGLPRIDHILNKKEEIRNKIINRYPNIIDKKVILYAPTFRTTLEDNSQKLIDCIDFEKYNLIIKEHYNQKLNYSNSVVYNCQEFSPLELLSVADVLITDYSAVSIEAAVINLKTYYYLFDYEVYSYNNGINIDLFNDMPNSTFKDEKELFNSINKIEYDFSSLSKFKENYLPKNIGTSTKLIVELILKWYYNH